jgi:outer membrane protein insertion porin family
VGQAIVAGNARTKQKVVLRELDADTLGAGALWTPSGQRLLEQRLLGLGIFGGAEIRSTGGRRIDRGDVEKGKVEIQEKDVRIAVNERPAGSVEFGPGFRSDRGVIGFAEVTYRNLGGWNRGVLARAEVSRKIENYQFPEQKYSFAYLEPYLANLRLRLRFGVDYTRRDQITFENGNKKDGFNAEESSFSFLLERQLTERLKLVHNFFTLSLANYTDIQSQNSGLRKYQIGSTGPTFTYDSRDNIFNPTAGWLSNTSFEFSAPAIGSRGNAHYFIGRQALTHYHRVFDRSSVAMLASYSRIRALGGTGNLPEGKRFYMGGSASLRSFSQNALGFEELGVLDQQAMEFKLEYRQPVFLDAGLAFFFDAGRIDVLSPAMLTDVNGATLPRTTGLRKAVGVGLRYTTPVGPLAVDFAYNVDRKPGEANDFKLQFSIGSF